MANAINRLKAELSEKTSTIYALEAHDEALRDQLRAAEEEIAIKPNAMYKAERALSDRTSDLEKLSSELDKCSKRADSQKLEIIARWAQIEATKARDELLLYVMGTRGAPEGNRRNGAHPPIPNNS